MTDKKERKAPNKTDKLTQDVLQAEAEGYGCHYGAYMAAKRERERMMEVKLREAEAEKNKADEERKALAAVVTKPKKQERPERMCCICGKPLPRRFKKAHPIGCAAKYEAQKKEEARKKKKEK